MNPVNEYNGLKFQQRARPLPRRLITVGIAAVVFGGLWWIVPPNTLFWLLLPLVMLLAWMASYGWKQAIVALHALLHRLEHL